MRLFEHLIDIDFSILEYIDNHHNRKPTEEWKHYKTNEFEKKLSPHTRKNESKFSVFEICYVKSGVQHIEFHGAVGMLCISCVMY